MFRAESNLQTALLLGGLVVVSVAMTWWFLPVVVAGSAFWAIRGGTTVFATLYNMRVLGWIRQRTLTPARA